ncbi:similar to Saccharomyces cerevisiae YAL044W-A Putative protein of unknown function [Maudiozyma saulgeensis]|uniref:BolA protein n=1 Tax=Maudiozyma saulgeensis TaxID=1789683 RepID=A0A1X7R747_9SACH|nr:similar to Saccharomyces cerevisiae YAL044W-A Putative protein of unknown function [Kazachstania saulgeensis]
MLRLTRNQLPFRVISRDFSFTSKRIMSQEMSLDELPLNRRIDGPVISSVKDVITKSMPSIFNLSIYNDSYKHEGHHGIGNSSNKTESHIRLEIISDEFSGLNLPNRHRMIYKILGNDMKKYDIHAVQLSTKTIAESNKS